MLPSGEPEDLKSRPPHFEQQFHGSWSRRGKGAPLYENGLPVEEIKERIRHTYGMIESVDRNVGLVLDELMGQGLMENTVVILASDHGELLGDHGLWLKGPFLYEGLINTPLLIHVPGIAPRVSQAMVSAVDIMPTILQLTGCEVPAYVDGVSQVPHITDNTKRVRNACMVEYRNGYNCDVFVNAIVGEGYKYVMYETGEEEYTDLELDPEERRNVAGEKAYGQAVEDRKSVV